MKQYLLILIMALPAISNAQTVTDGLMMPKNALCTGFIYTNDQWTDYWEGTLERENGNIGKVTTQSLMWVGNYGILDNLNFIAMLPYVKTEASQGTLQGMEDIQDLSLSLKYNFFKKAIGDHTFKTFGVVSYSMPLTDYTPDFLPLSIGMASKNLSWRLTSYFKMQQGMYVNASAAYTWRSNVTLDRPSYYSDGQFYSTDEVEMPNVFDFVVNVGYIKQNLQLDLSYTQQNTLGGGDIRRQDMPFASNRMNFSKVGALVMYYLPKPRGLALRGSAMTTVAGRNVGKSTTLMGGILYTIHFSKEQ